MPLHRRGNSSTAPFYIRDLSICRFWYLLRVLRISSLQILRNVCILYLFKFSFIDGVVLFIYIYMFFILVEGYYYTLFPFLCVFLFRAAPAAYGGPTLGVESELQLPAYTTTTATLDLSCFCSLHHSSRQRWILNPLGEARDRTHVLMDASQVRSR